MILSAIFWRREGSLPTPWVVGRFLALANSALASLPPGKGSSGRAGIGGDSAEWVFGNGKWGEGRRQGLGQEVHGHVCSGITREKRVIKKAIQELQKNRTSQR